MNKLILILALIIVAGCFHLDELPAEFVSQPPKEIQEQYNQAIEGFAQANKFIIIALKHEKNSNNLVNTKSNFEDIPVGNYISAISELGLAKTNLEQSIQENKKSIRILQKIKSTQDPSLNPEKMRQLIEIKLYGNLLSTQTLICHDKAISSYQTFARSDFSNSIELEDDYEDCNDKRIFVEEYILREAWLKNETIKSPLPGLELNEDV